MKLQIDIKKIITLLAKDIYDSPYALLRENLQNAYDAILMRKSLDSSFEPRIDIVVASDTIKIIDNGIGMTYNQVENNFWKAGSSGKNNEAARKAGVVGTFGIGAMANFGICQRLDVTTRYYSDTETIHSSLYWEDLSYSDDCIKTERVSDANLPIGTTVEAMLQEGTTISKATALNYLIPYVQYLSIPVFLNNSLISQRDYTRELMESKSGVISETKVIEDDEYSYNIEVKFLPYNNGLITVHIFNILYRKTPVTGDLVLVQDKSSLFGLRNGFGLASIPLASTYRWGGVANLNNIVPTAGRDSVIRESVDFVAALVRHAERRIADMYARHEVCDNNTEFLAYLYGYSICPLELLANIRISRQPEDDRYKLGDIKDNIGCKNAYYYTGNDSTIIHQFANENSILFVLSQNRIRKSLQARYLDAIGIQPIPDKVSAQKLELSSLSTSDLAISIKIEFILENDYLLNNVKVQFATISHNQPSLVEKNGDTIYIYIAHNSSSLNNLRNVYKDEYSLFEGFVKDYVRQHLYNKVSIYVPSATREGAEALMKIMKQKRDLFSIEDRETGEIDEVLREYLAGNATIQDVHRASKSTYNTQRQEVSSDSIGKVEDIVPSACVNDEEEQPAQQQAVADFAQPPIINSQNETKLKLLKAQGAYPGLNGHQMFLALSDKLFERYSDFFFEPHTTKVIWSTHKIVYVFTHISNQFSMYYDIDLNEMLPGELTGGRPIVSTTIITKYKIFVPVIPEMYQYFDSIQQKGRLEFYVRFDTMAGNND